MAVSMHRPLSWPRGIFLVLIKDRKARAIGFFLRKDLLDRCHELLGLHILPIEYFRDGEPDSSVQVPLLIGIACDSDEWTVRRDCLIDRAASALANRHVGGTS